MTMIDEKKIDTDMIDSLNKTIKQMRGDVRGFFADLDWNNGTVEIELDEVNEFLALINVSPLKRKYSGTAVFAFDFNGVEADSQDDLKQVIEDATEIMFDYDHNNTYIQDITDVEEE